MRFVLSFIYLSLTLRHDRALLAFSLHLGSLGFGVVVGRGYIDLHLIIEYKQMQPIFTTTRRSLLLIGDEQSIDNRFIVLLETNMSILVALVRHRVPIIFDHRLAVVCKLILDVTANDLRFNHGTYPIGLLHLLGDLIKQFTIFLVCF